MLKCNYRCQGFSINFDLGKMGHDELIKNIQSINYGCFAIGYFQNSSIVLLCKY